MIQSSVCSVSINIEILMGECFNHIPVGNADIMFFPCNKFVKSIYVKDSIILDKTCIQLFCNIQCFNKSGSAFEAGYMIYYFWKIPISNLLVNFKSTQMDRRYLNFS